MSLRFNMMLQRRDNFLPDGNWELTHTVAPDGSFYASNRESMRLVKASWLPEEDVDIVGRQYLKSENIPEFGQWFGENSYSYIADISVGADMSRVYILVLLDIPEYDGDEELLLYDAKILQYDAHNFMGPEVQTFAFLPCWDQPEDEMKKYVVGFRPWDVREATAEVDIKGLGTHSENLKRVKEFATIVSHMGHLYITLPVYYRPADVQMQMLYVLKEDTHEFVGCGVLGEISWIYQSDFLYRPIKTNATVIDDTLVFRNLRASTLKKDWYKKPERFDKPELKYTWKYGVPLVPMESLEYFMQPRTVCYVDLETLHAQIAGSSLQNPVIVETTEMFNAGVIGAEEWTGLCVDQTYRRIYTHAEGMLHEYNLDFLLLDVWLGHRWVPIYDVTFPFLIPAGGALRVQLTNGAVHTQLRNIRIQPDTAGTFTVSPDFIDTLLPQSTTEVTLQFTPTSDTILHRPFNIEYATYY